MAYQRTLQRGVRCCAGHPQQRRHKLSFGADQLLQLGDVHVSKVGEFHGANLKLVKASKTLRTRLSRTVRPARQLCPRHDVLSTNPRPPGSVRFVAATQVTTRARATLNSSQGRSGFLSNQLTKPRTD